MAGQKIDFLVGGSTMRCHDAAIVLDDDDPLATLIDAVIQNISTTVMVTVGATTLHLAAWQDPEHWSEDWQSLGIDPVDVPALVAAQMRSA